MAKILVVDDEAMILDLCRTVLTRNGHEVLTASSVERALELLDTSRPDLIISDIRMPEMSGVEFLEMVDERWPETPFVFVSGFATLEVTLDALKKGASGFVVKPFSVEELEETVERVLQLDHMKKENVRLRSLVPIIAVIREMTGKTDIGEVVEFFVERLREMVGASDVNLCPSDNDPWLRRYARGGGMCSRRADVVTCGQQVRGGEKLRRVRRSDADGALLSLMDEANVIDILCFCLDRDGVEMGKVLAIRKEGEGEFAPSEEYGFEILCQQFERQLQSMEYTNELNESLLEFIDSLLAALEARDAYTGTHGTSVSDLSVEIGRRLGLPARDLDLLESAGKLHDVGKIGIPDLILLKPGKLTDEEFEQIRRHPLIGYEILSKHKSMRAVADIVRHHHEWYGGGGYPDGLRGEEIPLLARIVSVCDALHALTSDRPYRPAFSLEKALRILEEDTPRKFDPKIVGILKELFGSGKLSAAS